jgi:hypothetical protein
MIAAANELQVSFGDGLRALGVSWREVARALEIPMSTVIDACRSCCCFTHTKFRLRSHPGRRRRRRGSLG